MTTVGAAAGLIRATEPGMLNPTTGAAAGTTGVPVTVKVTSIPGIAGVEATTVIVPTPGAKVVWAWPCAFVRTRALVTVPVPEVTVNATNTPDTGLLLASVTVTTSGALSEPAAT